ncbi:hypothetical protein K491DRAFT_696026 [Lophiostoma macrostomum CBS 122681]|uniref:C2H2-type domain-containing protein n=1 Tax=Lophiostoma macrostomum CBS 122681 TaxID=1314788 RepID=A0A6A6SWM6_9PLEO|nr:hypothetical protein K491DRAFT_696026 [Lophiostoma macrostomum CBS 122681]
MAGLRNAPAVAHYCGICGKSFKQKHALQMHMTSHAEAKITHVCEVCNWYFDDSLQLEQHQITAGHMSAPAENKCDNVQCSQTFASAAELRKHKQYPKPCSDAFKLPTASDQRSRKNKNWAHVNHPPTSYGLDAPSMRAETVQSFGGNSVVSEGVHCHKCQRTFPSIAIFNRHFLSGCHLAPPNGLSGSKHFHGQSQPDDKEKMETMDASLKPVNGNNLQGGISNGTSSSIALELQEAAESKSTPALARSSNDETRPRSLAEASKPMAESVQEKPTPQRPSSVAVSSSPQGPATSNGSASVRVARSSSQAATHAAPTPLEHRCGIKGCDRAFRSEPGLKTHQLDAHGVGGQGLDLHGKDAFMLSNKAREQLRVQGLLRASPLLTNKPGGTRRTPSHRQTGINNAPGAPLQPQHSGRGRLPLAAHVTGNAPALPIPSGTSIGTPDDAKQAEDICGKIMRLAIQANVAIHQGGKMTVGGTDWTRVGVEKQRDLVEMFKGLVHLPKKLQPLEYLPAPKAFKDEYDTYYSVEDFENSPEPSNGKTALKIVVLACSKVLMSDGCQEAVKISAIDLPSCRILLHHLVCPEPREAVKDWHTTSTGLTSYNDIEAARVSGYKVFKGWQAVRAALWKFIDNQTILVGHNLRGDLDALRMIHGRSVDVAKVIEKIAEGPLSKAQLSLDTLCRDLVKVYPPGTSKFGRDYLWNVFAAREITLYRIRNEEACKKFAKAKSLDYQKVVAPQRA